MKQVIFLNSHPIQYFAPLYKYMNTENVVTKAWYCSDESVKGGKDKQFGVNVKWDIPMLDGYEYKFFKNYSWKPSTAAGFFGLINFGVIRELWTMPKSVIIVHGWHYFTHLSVLLFGKIKGHTICLRNDMPQKQEELKSGFKQLLKRKALTHFLFPRIDYFLYIGNQNRLFYKKFDIPDQRLLSCPYAVDNDRFSAEYTKNIVNKAQIKERLGVPANHKIIIFSGKYIDKKKPLDLLNAFALLNLPEVWLIMVGEGELRSSMEQLIGKQNIKRVILTGFVNQSKIAEYYTAGDLFVMCSFKGENWGLSVNEAMNFNLPIIVSDLTGCADDLVEDGVNGYVFKTADVKELASKMRDVLVNNTLSFSESSKEIINRYSFREILKHLKTIL